MIFFVKIYYFIFYGTLHFWEKRLGRVAFEWLMVYRLCYWLFSGKIWMTIAWSLISAWWSNVAKQRSVFCCRQRCVEASSEIHCLRTWRSSCLFRPHLSLRTLLATNAMISIRSYASIFTADIPHIWDPIFCISWFNCLHRTCLDHWPGFKNSTGNQHCSDSWSAQLQSHSLLASLI